VRAWGVSEGACRAGAAAGEELPQGGSTGNGRADRCGVCRRTAPRILGEVPLRPCAQDGDSGLACARALAASAAITCSPFRAGRAAGDRFRARMLIAAASP